MNLEQCAITNPSEETPAVFPDESAHECFFPSEDWVRLSAVPEEEYKSLEAASERFMQTQDINSGPIIASTVAVVEFFKNGKPTDKKKGIVIVRYQFSKDVTVSDQHEQFEGISIIPLLGYFRLTSKPVMKIERTRQVCKYVGPGCSIGTERSPTGTLCCVLDIGNANGKSKRFGLSASHVLATGENESRVLQPGMAANPVEPRREIGTFKKTMSREDQWATGQLQPHTHAGDVPCRYIRDWALFELDEGIQVTDRVRANAFRTYEYSWPPAPSLSAAIPTGTKVFKLGYNGLNDGELRSRCTVYTAEHDNNIIVTDQNRPRGLQGIMIQSSYRNSFADHGDSGAAVVDSETGTIVGMLMGNLSVTPSKHGSENVLGVMTPIACLHADLMQVTSSDRISVAKFQTVSKAIVQGSTAVLSRSGRLILRCATCGQCMHQ